MKLLRMLALTSVLGACSEKPADAPAPTKAPAAPAKRGLEGVSGTWGVKLSAKQEIELRNMALIFEAEDPSPDTLASLGPQERAAIVAMRAARKKAPDDPQFKNMQEALASMSKSQLEITTSSMTLTIGQVKQTAKISVLTETSTAITITAELPTGRSETMMFVYDGADGIKLAKPGQQDALSFIRKK